MNSLRDEITNWVSSKRRIINLLIGLSAVAFYELARAYYRPFIYSNGINDFHIADTLGNSLGTIATVFVFVSILGIDRAKDIFLIRTVTIAVIVYELAHPLLGKAIDPLDIVATLAAGIFSEILYRFIHRS
ncbi:MAG: hypothetical protein IT314_10760 [Anaerolineales bacterium]|nr:hypothetical protein [Anaerolineales bacterium]